MSFYKTALTSSIGTASFEASSSSLRRVASSTDDAASAVRTVKSYYVDGARKLDIAGMLKQAADKYNISANPSDYFFEAIRANTVNVPNENHDCFHRSELLRFDVKYVAPFGDKVGSPVYMTYVGKPHHVNHKADDPKRARGVILDAHYNDDAPALEHCPTCNHRTAEVQGRDESGIHCASCGDIVKDEFIETLVAVDSTKDPDFARNVRAGLLTANSMGCNCASTVCNVCRHVAHSVSEFCEHIRSGNKGSLWMRKAGTSKFEKVKPATVVEMLKRVGFKQRGTLERSDDKGSRLISVALNSEKHDFEVRKAFEFCQGVEYDELSRVHKPADPSAHTVELLKAAGLDTARTHALINSASAHPMTLSEETELLLLRTRIGDIESRITRNAQLLPMRSDVTTVIPDGARMVIQDPHAIDPNDPNAMAMPPQPAMPGAPGAPGMAPPGTQPPGVPPSIEDVTQQQLGPQDPQMSESEFGMLPPGASGDLSADAESDVEDEDDDMEQSAEGHENKEARMSTAKFAQAYGDFEVEVFGHRTVVGSSAGSIFTITPAAPLATDEAKLAFGREVGDHLVEHGLVRTVAKYAAVFSERFAQVTDGAISDMQEGRPSPQSALEGRITTMRSQSDSHPDSPVEGADDDMQDARPAPADSAVKSRDTDMADEADAKSPDSLSATKEVNEAAKEKHEQRSMSDDSLRGGQTDMKGNAGSGKKAGQEDIASDTKALEARYRKLYASRLTAEKERFEAEKAAFAEEKRLLEASLMDRVKRAMKIAAKRQALNLEISPLKVMMVDSLTVQRPIGRTASGDTLSWAGLGEDLALHLVEAAWDQSASEEIDRLVQRCAEIMNYGDSYIASAEQDLSKQASVVPEVVAHDQLEPADEVQARAAEMRRSAAHGNLNIAPGMADAGAGAGFDKSAAIRAALAPTKVGRFLEGAGRN